MIIMFLFFLLISTNTATITNDPELQLAFSFEALDAFKNTALKQFIEEKADNMVINETFPLDEGPLHFQVSNIAISQFSLDWQDSHLVTLDNNNKPSIVLQNISLLATFDASVKFLALNISGSGNTVLIAGLDITVDLDFGTFPNETAYVYISDSNVKLGTFYLTLSNKVAEFLVKTGQKLDFPIAKITSSIINKTILGLNDTIIEKSSSGVQLELLNFLEVEGSLASVPVVFNVDSQAFQSLALNLQLTNSETGQTAPVAPVDSMPTYEVGGLPIQIFLSENVIGQALWAAFQSDLLDLEISNANLTASSPVSLNTSTLTILFPNLQQDYGSNKGLYLKIQKGGENTLVAIRDGRLMVEIPLQFDFWVDTDSSQYPIQGLDKCTTCELAISFNVEVFAAVDLYQKNATHIGAQVIDAQLQQIQLLSGDLDLTSFSNTLDNLLTSVLLQANTVLQDGIPNPLLGLYGVNETVLEVGNNYLFVGLSFDSS